MNLLQVHGAEKRMHKCFHCGTELKQWNPLCLGKDGEYRMETSFKWCTNCKWILFQTLAVYLGFGLPEIDDYIRRENLPLVRCFPLDTSTLV